MLDLVGTAFLVIRLKVDPKLIQESVETVKRSTFFQRLTPESVGYSSMFSVVCGLETLTSVTFGRLSSNCEGSFVYRLSLINNIAREKVEKRQQQRGRLIVVRFEAVLFTQSLWRSQSEHSTRRLQTLKFTA